MTLNIQKGFQVDSMPSSVEDLSMHEHARTRGRAVISITEVAAAKISELIARRNKPTAGIRVGIKSGGCSGLAYTFEYADERSPSDEEVTEHGVTVFIAAKAMLHIIGTTLDYKDEKIRSGFVFINPNEKGRCGCGESFYTYSKIS